MAAMAAALKAPPYAAPDVGCFFRAICRRQVIAVKMAVSVTANPKWTMRNFMRVMWPNVKVLPQAA
jgi:hypothetical protein